MAAKYRAPIFSLIDRNIETDWYFGEPIDDIKEMDLSTLKRVKKVSRKSIRGPLYWQNGVASLLHNPSYSQYIITGEPYCLSTWWMLIKKKLFFRNKRIFMWSHGWYGNETRLKKWIKNLFFGLADGTFLYGNHAREIAAGCGADTEKLFVIHNSLDYEKHIALRNTISESDIYTRHFGNSYPTLIFIGRLTKTKQLHLILEALAILRDKGEEYNMVFVGDGEERKGLEKMAESLHLPVWFYGSCYDEAENAELIYNADLCVSPGNVGLTAIHSMTFGTPVLTNSDFSTQMPEFEAIREGSTGSFFEKGSKDDLAAAISGWFAAPGYSRKHIRQACYEEIDSSWTPQFQLDVIMKHLTDI